MIFIDCQQGSEEWLQARAGIITASKFSDAISVLKKASGEKKSGDPTAASDKYACDLAIERRSNKPYGEPVKSWVLERGHEMERLARIDYEATTGELVYESGIVLTDDRLFGYSTDGFVGDDGLIEVKTPIDSLKIEAMLLTEDVSEYQHQMQGGMWITGRKWCDLIMPIPDLKFHFKKRVFRDDDFIDSMVDELMKFAGRVSIKEQFFKLKAA